MILESLPRFLCPQSAEQLLVIAYLSAQMSSASSSFLHWVHLVLFETAVLVGFVPKNRKSHYQTGQIFLLCVVLITFASASFYWSFLLVMGLVSVFFIVIFPTH